jgi:hypothetical protein
MDKAIWDGYYDEYRDNIDNYADWEDYDESLDDAIRPVCMTGRIDADEMTEEDWDRYSADFERRYNEHARSIKSSCSRRVGRSTASRYYDEEDDLDNLLPTTEYLQRLARESGIDRDYNVHMAFRHAVEEMIRDDDTMASYFAMSQL